MYARGWLRVNKVSYEFEVIKNWKPLAHMWLRETLKLARRIGWKSSRIQTRPPFGQLAQHFQLNAQNTYTCLFRIFFPRLLWEHK